MTMLNYKTTWMRLSMAAMSLSAVFGVNAQNTVTLAPEDFILTSLDQVQRVYVNLQNEDPVQGMNFDIVLPSDLEIVGKPQLYRPETDSRFGNNSHVLTWNEENLRCMIFTTNQKFIGGNDGYVAYFDVKASDANGNPFAEGHTSEITLSTIALGNGDFESKPIPVVNDAKSTVTFSLGTFALSGSKTLDVVPGQSLDLSLDLANTGRCNMIKLTFTMPEGVSMDEDSFMLTDRLDNNTKPFVYNPVVLEDGSSMVNVLLMNLAENVVLYQPGDGTFCNFTMNVSKDFKAENAEIVVTGNVTQGKTEIEFDPVTFTINNHAGDVLAENEKAYEAAQAEGTKLQTKLDEALQAIADEYGEEVADLEEVKALYAQGGEVVANLGEEMTAQYDAANADFSPFAFIIPESVEAEIDNIISQMNAAAKKFVDGNVVAANQSKYNADLAEINALEAKYETAVEAANADYEGYVSEVETKEIYNKIESLKNEAEVLLNKANEDFTPYEFAGLDEQIAAIEAEIDAIADDAKENMRVQTNQAAHDADLAAIAQLNSDFRTVKKTILAQYPEYRDANAEELVSLEIQDATDVVAEAWQKAQEPEGVYESPEILSTLAAKVQELLTNARNASNSAALANVNKDEIAPLQAKLDAAIAGDKDYAEYVSPELKKQAQDLIDGIAAAAETALETANEAGEDFSYNVPEEDVKAVDEAIEALVADAMANKAKADEADRNTVNQAKYDAAIAEVNALQATLDAAVSEDKPYADYIDENLVAAAQNAIDTAKNEAEAEKTRVETAGVYGYTVDATAINAEIAKIVTDAEAKKAAADKAAAEAEAARKAANEDAYNEVKNQIDALQAAYDAAVAEDNEYYDSLDTDLASDIAEEIVNLGNDADAAYAAVADEGNFEFTVDSEAIQAKIDQLVADAIANMSELVKYGVTLGNVDLDEDNTIDLGDAGSVQSWVLTIDMDSEELYQYMYGEGESFNLNMRKMALAADVTRDQNINMADYAAIINYMYNKTWPEVENGAAKASAMEDQLYTNLVLTERVNGISRYAVMLDNRMDLTAGQFNVVLAEGSRVVATNVAGRTTGHEVAFKNHEGHARVVICSEVNALFDEGAGAIAYIDVEGEASGLEMVIFANNKGNAFYAAPCGETSVDMVVSGANETVFDAQGRVQDGFKKGVNIVRSSDGSVKKVIR